MRTYVLKYVSAISGSHVYEEVQATSPADAVSSFQSEHTGPLRDRLLGLFEGKPMPQDSTPPEGRVVTIDDMIGFLSEMRARSPLGGDTVLHWSEENRPVIPIGRVRLEVDDDGAVVEVSQ